MRASHVLTTGLAAASLASFVSQNAAQALVAADGVRNQVSTPSPSHIVGIPEGGGVGDLAFAGRTNNQLGSFNIIINPTPALAANPAALAAFERAAVQWESWISDPVTVSVNADFTSVGFPSPSIIGSTGAVSLAGGYTLVRDQLVADALDEGLEDIIVASLPTAANFSAFIPSGRSLTGQVSLTKANAKALGFTGLDTTFGTSDGQIKFNSAFAFDFDNSDGVGSGLTDFETVAAHELGHLLGFTSVVDSVDATTATQLPQIDIGALDLFRFADNVVNSDPSNAAEFATFVRDLRPGAADIFDDATTEYLLSTGQFGGDGRQASHWKDNNLTGNLIGMLDPTLAAGQVFPLSAADLRAFDLIGYDLSIPEPTTVAMLGVGVLATFRRRR